MQCDAARLGELNSVRATLSNEVNVQCLVSWPGVLSAPQLPHVSSFRDTEGPGERGELSKHWASRDSQALRVLCHVTLENRVTLT